MAYTIRAERVYKNLAKVRVEEKEKNEVVYENEVKDNGYVVALVLKHKYGGEVGIYVDEEKFAITYKGYDLEIPRNDLDKVENCKTMVHFVARIKEILEKVKEFANKIDEEVANDIYESTIEL